jgi:hypothetical protein
MTPCPKCLAPLDELPALRPGDFPVCPSCAVILCVGENYAVAPALPPDIDRLPKTKFEAVLQTSMRAMAKRLWRTNPLNVKHQQEKERNKPCPKN